MSKLGHREVNFLVWGNINGKRYCQQGKDHGREEEKADKSGYQGKGTGMGP